jgi:dUTP pyrophosphatase
MRDTSVQVRTWADAGALVVTIQDVTQDPLEVAGWCRGLLRRRADEASRVATERPADLLPYVQAHPDATRPTKAYPDDAGIDLAACESVVIPVSGKALVKTGLKFALPAGMWGLIVGRSSTWAKKRLDVKLGVIDAGWRGELFISIENRGDEDYKVEVGERLAQYILLPAWQGAFAEVGMLPEHARGENGFGSSG